MKPDKIDPIAPHLSQFASQVGRTLAPGKMADTGNEEEDFSKQVSGWAKKTQRVGKVASQSLGGKLRSTSDKAQLANVARTSGIDSSAYKSARDKIQRRAKMRMMRQRSLALVNFRLLNPRSWIPTSLRALRRWIGRGIRAAMTNPYVLAIVGGIALAILVIAAIVALIMMVIIMATTIAITSYLADDYDLNSTTIAYTEGEVVVKEYLLSMGVGGFNEAASFLNGGEQVRLVGTWSLETGPLTIGDLFGDEVATRILVMPLMGAIRHCPHVLLSGFTALYHDEINYPQIRPRIFGLIDQQYEIITEDFYEIRSRTVIMTFGEYQDHGWYEYDDDGYSHWIEDWVWVEWQEPVVIEYEWHSMHIYLNATPMEFLFREMFRNNPDREEGADQEEHFDMFLEIGHGNRQFVGSPFPFRWDGFVSSHFGYRLDPFSLTRQMHRGTDIALPTGIPVLASQGGVVTRAEYQANGFGNWVEITHYIPARLFPPRLPYMIHTRYAHLHQISVYVGQELEAGDPIGMVGSTGASTGAHLHFEIIRTNWLGNRTHFNPFIFGFIGDDD